MSTGRGTGKNHPRSCNTNRMPLEQKTQQNGGNNVSTSSLSNEMKRRQYRCDICKILIFPTMEEACRHEEECRRTTSTNTLQNNNNDSNDNESSRSHKKSSPRKKRKTNASSAAAAAADNVDQMDTDISSSSSLVLPIEVTTKTTTTTGGNWLTAASAATKKKSKTTTTTKSTARKKTTTTAVRSVPSKEKEVEKKKPKATTAVVASKIKKPASTASMNAFFSASTYVKKSGGTTSSSNGAAKNSASSSMASSSAAATVTTVTASAGNNVTDDTTKITTTAAAVVNNKSTTTTAPVAKKTRAKKVKKADAAASLQLAPLFLEGADYDKLLAEHVAAEFQAKRRQREQQERERQARRQIALGQVKQQQHHCGYTAAAATGGKNSKATPTYSLECRFPKESHVHPKVDYRANSSKSPTSIITPCAHWLTDEMRLQARTALQKAWWPGSEAPPPVVATTDTATTSSTTNTYPLQSDAICLEYDHSTSILDEETTFSFQALANLLLRPPPRPAEESSSSSTTDSNTLWTDKYSFASSDQHPPCGTSLQNAFQSLQAMIHDWKVVRQKANERMEERQRALVAKSMKSSSRVQKKKTSTTRRKKIDDDDDEYDDCWMDSDDEDREYDGGLSNLCLITGPVASGKTSLVHAVARHADCCVVLEINTLQKRGAAALRKVLEEATQSHSSLDMLQKQQRQQATSMFNSIATTRRQQQQQELVDTDDENHEESSSCATSNNINNNNKQGSNVTIVLLDEVDLLYEEDAGFWNALSDVTKRAKSPIILTAERLPDEMKSSSFYYKHIHVERPTPDECVDYLRGILLSEGFSIQQGMEEQLDKQLLLLAEFYNSDLRRISHELELMLLFNSSKQSLPKDTDMAPAPDNLKETQQEKTLPCLPQLESIKPKSIASSQFSLVTITGSGFLSLAAKSTTTSAKSDGGYPVLVEVGSQYCPEARIMDDSTILAIVPPCESRSNVNASGNFCYTNIRCLTACYAPVHVHGVKKLGLLSSTAGGMVSSTELVDGTKIATFNAIVNLEYHFAQTIEYYFAQTAKSNLLKSIDKDESSDSEEAEFEDSNPIISTTSTASCHQPAISVISSENQKIIDTLLQEGLTAWHSRHGKEATDVEQMSLVCDETNGTSCRLENDSAVPEMDSIAELASDAAFFEDVLVGIPYLSGTVRGFGFELTDAFPLYNNQKSKFPSEESLFASGWKDSAFFHGCSNTHVCLPTGRRERMLMLRCERTLRGKAFRSEEFQQDPVEDEEGDVVFLENSEEDMYLANPMPHSLSLLPSQFKKVAVDKAGAIGATLISQDPLFHRKRLAKLEHGMDMLEKCDSRLLFPWLKLFVPCISRQLDPMLDMREMIDKRVFLDYLPLLRCMAVLERAAEVASLEDDPLSQELSQASAYEGRRVTRRGRKRGRVHYFEQAFECFSSTDVNDKQAKSVGEMFAAAALLQKE